MRGADFSSGANYQSNLSQDSGVLEKVKQNTPFVDASDFSAIQYIGEFITSTGEKQALYFGLIDAELKLRAVEEDGTILTPTGGLGDFVFSGLITTRQVGTDVIIGYDGGNKLWDGEAITANGDEEVISQARDGGRVGYINTDGKAKFTDNTPTSGFTGGTGANANGDYNCGIPIATAIVEGGTGVIILGERNAEAHWVQPNNASDEVSSRTKIESFSYLGEGVTSERFVCSTGETLGLLNKSGVHEMDSYSGRTTNLIIGGKIERYWKERVDMTNGFIFYDRTNDWLIAQVALDSPQNNVFLAFNRKEKGMPPFIIPEQYLSHAGVVGEDIIGALNAGGETFKLLDSYSIPDGTTSKSRYITEFDGLGTMQEDKNLLSVTAITDVNPDAILKMKVYFDNETVPSLEKTISIKDLTVPDGNAAYGEYVFAVGASDLVKEKVVRGEKVKAGMRFKTIAVELWEESSDNFKVYDILLAYKATGRLSQTMSLKNNLF